MEGAGCAIERYIVPSVTFAVRVEEIRSVDFAVETEEIRSVDFAVETGAANVDLWRICPMPCVAWRYSTT